MSTLGLVVVAAVMAIGLLGTVVPLLPGLALIWLAAVGYGLAAGFGVAGRVALAVMTVLLAAGTAAKYVLPHRYGAARGASRAALMSGAALAVVGFFVVPVVGLPLGAVLGVLLAEHHRTEDWPRAWRSTKAVVVGFGIGALAEMGAGVAMIGCWAVWTALGR